MTGRGERRQELPTIDVGGFRARRYRLSAGWSWVSVLGAATVRIAWVADRFRVTLVHDPDQVRVGEWLEGRERGEWITVRAWTPPAVPTIPTDGMWNSIVASVRLCTRSPDGFTGYRDRNPGPGYLVTCSVPPSEADAVAVACESGGSR